MRDDWPERESAHFARYESRIALLEVRVEGLLAWCKKYEPVVQELREKDMLATAIADKVNADRGVRLTWVTALAGIAALFVPSLSTVLLVHFLHWT